MGSMRTRLAGLARITGTLLGLLAVSHLTTWFRGLPATYTMTGPSMAPSVGVHDWFLARPAPPRLQRGTMVLMQFRDEGEDHRVLRRVAGLPGDTLTMLGGKLAVNGEVAGWPFRVLEPRAERPLDGPVRGTIYSWGPVVVGDDSVFVLSDLRDMAGWPDSRFLGPIPRGLIEDEYVALLWRASQ